jgi:hypothetical protein
MRTLVFILSAAAILFLTTCEEEGPTTVGPNEAYPFVASIDRTGENNKAISEYSNNLYYLECLSDSLVFYSTSSEIILQSLLNPSNKFTIEASGDEGAKAYHEGSLIIFSKDRDICKVENRVNLIVNITNTADTFETYPIYLEEDSSLFYMTSDLNSEYLHSLVKHNLITNKKEKLYESTALYIIPLYTTSNGERLIFFETSLYDFDRGYYKSLSLTDYSSIQLLGSASLNGAINSSISDNDKIVHTSFSRTIIFDINTLNEKIIGYNNPQHSCISKNGNFIIEANDWSLYLYDGQGNTIKPLLEIVNGERYFHKVAISPSSNKIVYIQSKSPEYY